MFVVLTLTQVGYGAWGKGETKAEALRNARRNGGAPSKHGYTLYEFGPESKFEGVDGMGYLYWNGEKPTVTEVAARKR